MKKKIIICSLVVVLCTLLACNSPFFGSSQEESGEGNFTILIGNNTGRAVTQLPWDQSIPLADLRHTIQIINGSGVAVITKENIISGSPVNFSVTPGTYTIRAQGRYSGVLKAEGSIANKTIGQGQNGTILVPMGPPKDGLLSIAITIDTILFRTNYNIGDSLDFTGLEVVAQYAGGLEYEIPHRVLQIDFDSSTSGAKTVTVSYGVQSATITGIYVGTASLTGITITTNPTLTSYTVGESLDLSGLVVTANYSDSSTSTISHGSLTYYPPVFSTAGTITVTITYGNPPNQQTATFTVTVTNVSVTGVSLDQATLSLAVGATGTLTPTVAPSGATNQNVTWSSSAPTVATVNNGVVTAVGVGNATITVTTADGSFTATSVVTVTISGIPLPPELQAVADYLASSSDGANPGNPVNLVLPSSFDLGVMTSASSNWQLLLGVINSPPPPKYVNLDLSNATMNAMAGVFNPVWNVPTGKGRIVELTLPTVATIIFAGAMTQIPFDYFSALTEVSGVNVLTIGGHAFRDRSNLNSVSFPAAESIGIDAFRNTGLISITGTCFPMVRTIGNSAFRDCENLTSVIFPAAEIISGNVFFSCTNLSSAIFPAVTSIGSFAFQNTGLISSLSFPAATFIGQGAFRSSDSITSIDLPLVTSIGNETFQRCRSLTSVSLPLVASIDFRAFENCISLTTVTLGVNPPTVGSIIFSVISNTNPPADPPTKPLGGLDITVRIPAGSYANYGLPSNLYFDNDDTTTNNWGNAFRGRGWDGTNYLPGPVNANVRFTFEEYTP
jgi:hypothetical protein